MVPQEWSHGPSSFYLARAGGFAMIRLALALFVSLVCVPGCVDYGGGNDAGDGDAGDVDERKGLHQVCCVEEPLDECDHGLCEEGLTCYVLPYGPYFDSGNCCPSDSCVFTCNMDDCPGGLCDQGDVGCPEELTCRNSGTPYGDVCLP